MSIRENHKTTLLQLPRRQYYCLDQAAAYLQRRGALEDVDANYLLHLGATNQLALCIVCRPDWAFTYSWRFAGHNAALMMMDPDLQQYLYTPQKPIYVSPETCLNIELDGKHETTSTSYWLMTDDLTDTFGKDDPYARVWMDGGTKKPICYWLDTKADGIPPGITANMLVVTHSNMLRLIANDEISIVLPEKSDEKHTSPHGNTERNAAKRETVLKAAIALKDKYPDECKDAEKWASCIDNKALLFWPDTGEPPLAKSTIVDLLREAVKIPE